MPLSLSSVEALRVSSAMLLLGSETTSEVRVEGTLHIT